MDKIIYKEESYQIIGKCFEIHNIPGSGFLEIVYKDALEYELMLANVLYEREKEYVVKYKGIVLPHKLLIIIVIATHGRGVRIMDANQVNNREE